MPNPKRRHSRARRDKRRAHDALTRPVVSRCSNCDEACLPHRVCPRCGHYKGREVVEVTEV
ncbi:MAG TPA: 50S ribosomal protein L32 [Candidatus Polarisedimenticolia bacterium]|jgi:large subunit ribosomal protein L32|nr:50S ribosomal protein L32 [Candidatus Polarisedimenticolia bacterium]